MQAGAHTVESTQCHRCRERNCAGDVHSVWDNGWRRRQLEQSPQVYACRPQGYATLGDARPGNGFRGRQCDDSATDAVQCGTRCCRPQHGQQHVRRSGNSRYESRSNCSKHDANWGQQRFWGMVAGRDSSENCDVWFPRIQSGTFPACTSAKAMICDQKLSDRCYTGYCRRSGQTLHVFRVPPVLKRQKLAWCRFEPLRCVIRAM